MAKYWRIIRTIARAALLLTAAAVVVPTTFAATITGVSDKPTTLQTSQAANHTLLFTTPTGVAEGSTVTLSFSTSFDTSSITEDDVDVADDGTDLTTAASCAGTERASVAIASDMVTITICAGDGGAIAAGSQVTIEIGTNATASGTGTNRITNPSSTGTSFVTVAGTFGDDGSIALPIAGDDSVTVSATLPASSSGTGVGGTGDTNPTTDTTAPIISNIVVSGVTGSGATITWTTDEASTSLVDYGLTTSFEIGTITDSALVTSHSASLSGLSAGQTYYFRVRSADATGNQATSATQTFTTADTTVPIISGVTATDVTTTSARIMWITNESSTSLVAYGLTTSYGSSQSSSSLVTSHSITLTGLTTATTYHFQVGSMDASSNQAFSGDFTFTTDTDTAPANVSNLSAISSNTTVSLSWINPADADLSGVRVLSCLNAYPDSPTDPDCSVLTNALATSYAHTGLVNGTTYYYGLFAFDAAGQFASGALVTGNPSSASEEEPPSDEEESEESEEEGEPASEEEPGGEEEEEAPGGEEIPGESISGELEAPEGLSDADILFAVAAGKLTLAPVNGVIEVLPATTLTVALPASALAALVASVQVTVGSSTYLLSLDAATGLYGADIVLPAASGIYDVDVVVLYTDGASESVSSYLRVVAPGYVYQIIDGEEAAVAGATVTLFVREGNTWVAWDGSSYDQFNPTSTTVDGTFAWYVPNWMYYVGAQAAGFEGTQSSVLTVTNAIVNPRILLIAIGEEEEETILEEIVPSVEEVIAMPATVAQAITQAVASAVAQPVAAAQETLQTIREIPGVETAAVVSTPTLAVTAGASIVVLAVAFDFLPFLQYFFTAPVLFFWRRKRNSYGVVYNAISKTPVDLATVRLYQLTQEDEAAGRPGRLLKSRVTDRGGRYFFLVTPGRYRLTVTKVGYQFPTEYLKGEPTDGAYLDVYHGETIVSGGSGVVITANIPMDPSQAEKYRAPAALLLRARLRTLQHVVAAVGVIAATVFAIIRPNMFSIAMVGIQVLMYALAKRLARPHQPINWGIVYDKATGRPIARAIARIFEPKYNKVLETQVTDSRGRYAFLLGPNEYFAMFEKAGYEKKEVRPIDYTQSSEPKDFSEKVALDPEPPAP